MVFCYFLFGLHVERTILAGGTGIIMNTIDKKRIDNLLLPVCGLAAVIHLYFNKFLITLALK